MSENLLFVVTWIDEAGQRIIRRFALSNNPYQSDETPAFVALCHSTDRDLPAQFEKPNVQRMKVPLKVFRGSTIQAWTSPGKGGTINGCNVNLSDIHVVSLMKTLIDTSVDAGIAVEITVAKL